MCVIWEPLALNVENDKVGIAKATAPNYRQPQIWRFEIINNESNLPSPTLI